MCCNVIFGVIIGYLLGFIFDLICEPIRSKWRKDCNYNCKVCKVWDCQKKVCDYKKERNINDRH